MQQIRHLFIKIWIIFACLSCAITSSHANTATASQDAEMIAAQTVIQNKALTPMTSAQAQQSTSASSSAVPIKADQGDVARTQQVGLPQLNQPVIDQAGLLSSTENQQLSDKIRSIYQTGKAQIGVVIVPTTGQEDIFDYALRVAEKWQLGTKKSDNGLLIVVAVNDHKIQILTGYGLEGVIPDIVAYRIIQNQITPYFKQSQYAQGLSAGVDEINRIVSQDPDIAKQAADDLKSQQAAAHQQQQALSRITIAAAIILFIAVFFSAIFGRKLSALGAGVAGVAVGVINGIGIFPSLALGLGLSILIISAIAQLILQTLLSGLGRGGGGGGSSGGSGGGFSGGGGSFGGGGASGSW